MVNLSRLQTVPTPLLYEALFAASRTGAECRARVAWRRAAGNVRGLDAWTIECERCETFVGALSAELERRGAESESERLVRDGEAAAFAVLALGGPAVAAVGDRGN